MPLRQIHLTAWRLEETAVEASESPILAESEAPPAPEKPAISVAEEKRKASQSRKSARTLHLQLNPYYEKGDLEGLKEIYEKTAEDGTITPAHFRIYLALLGKKKVPWEEIQAIFDAHMDKELPIDSVVLRSLLLNMGDTDQAGRISKIIEALEKDESLLDANLTGNLLQNVLLTRTLGVQERIANMELFLDRFDCPAAGFEKCLTTIMGIIAKVQVPALVELISFLLGKVDYSQWNPPMSLHVPLLELALRKELPNFHDLVEHVVEREFVLSKGLSQAVIFGLNDAEHFDTSIAFFQAQEEISPDAKWPVGVYMGMLEATAGKRSKEMYLAVMMQLALEESSPDIPLNAIIDTLRTLARDPEITYKSIYESAWSMQRGSTVPVVPRVFLEALIAVSSSGHGADLNTAYSAFTHFSTHFLYTPTLLAYNPLLEACSKLGQVDGISRLLETMQSVGLQGDATTYFCEFNAYARVDRPEEALATVYENIGKLSSYDKRTFLVRVWSAFSHVDIDHSYMIELWNFSIQHMRPSMRMVQYMLEQGYSNPDLMEGGEASGRGTKFRPVEARRPSTNHHQHRRGRN